MCAAQIPFGMVKPSRLDADQDGRSALFRGQRLARATSTATSKSREISLANRVSGPDLARRGGANGQNRRLPQPISANVSARPCRRYRPFSVHIDADSPNECAIGARPKGHSPARIKSAASHLCGATLSASWAGHRQRNRPASTATQLAAPPCAKPNRSRQFPTHATNSLRPPWRPPGNRQREFRSSYRLSVRNRPWRPSHRPRSVSSISNHASPTPV